MAQCSQRELHYIQRVTNHRHISESASIMPMDMITIDLDVADSLALSNDIMVNIRHCYIYLANLLVEISRCSKVPLMPLVGLRMA